MGKKFAVEFEDDEPEFAESAPAGRFSGGGRPDNRFAAPAAAQSNPMIKMMAVPLVIALGLKGWSLMDFASHNQLMPAYLCSEVGSLIAIFCVIVLCLTSGGSGGR